MNTDKLRRGNSASGDFNYYAQKRARWVGDFYHSALGADEGRSGRVHLLHDLDSDLPAGLAFEQDLAGIVAFVQVDGGFEVADVLVEIAGAEDEGAVDADLGAAHFLVYGGADLGAVPEAHEGRAGKGAGKGAGDDRSRRGRAPREGAAKAGGFGGVSDCWCKKYKKEKV